MFIAISLAVVLYSCGATTNSDSITLTEPDEEVTQEGMKDEAVDIESRFEGRWAPFGKTKSNFALNGGVTIKRIDNEYEVFFTLDDNHITHIPKLYFQYDNVVFSI